MRILLVASLVGLAGALELTPENWDELTAGKTAFIKFLAPWWGHCKSMKPAWDKLMKDFEGNKGVIVADVDCTEEGKDLCETHGVEGFPTIKWGAPDALEDYEGGRDYEELSAFAKENLKPMCSPSNLDLCTPEKKAKIEELQKMSKEKLDEEIAAQEKLLTEANENFEKEVEKLQAKYEELEKEKSETIKKVKESGLSILKAVAAHKEKTSDEL